jgi:hypothetical protein
MALTRCTVDLQQCAKPGSIVQSVCSTPGCNAAQDRIPSAVSPPTKIPSPQRNADPVVVQSNILASRAFSQRSPIARNVQPKDGAASFQIQNSTGLALAACTWAMSRPIPV